MSNPMSLAEQLTVGIQKGEEVSFTRDQFGIIVNRIHTHNKDRYANVVHIPNMDIEELEAERLSIVIAGHLWSLAQSIRQRMEDEKTKGQGHE